MRDRLMKYLACPLCRSEFELDIFERTPAEDGGIETGLLHCSARHFFPITRGIPRLLPDALVEWEPSFAPFRAQLEKILDPMELSSSRRHSRNIDYDRRSKENFTLEWQSWNLADGTWDMTPVQQLELFFLNPLASIGAKGLISQKSLVVDAGCGPGMPSLEYARLGMEVIALDLSGGLEHGDRIRRSQSQEVKERLHFVQGDLMRPPLKFGIADIVSSLGVISSTPDTKQSFDSIARFVRPEGVLSVWVYGYERFVTPLVESIRRLTTRVPPSLFAKFATVCAPLFQGFCWGVNKVGLRTYGRAYQRSRHAARTAVMDIFGAPYCHWHTVDELNRWFRQHGFTHTAEVARSRRGFGVIGIRRQRQASVVGRNEVQIA
jgi:uncharacterized protein YbaR (Trm112 family)